MPAVESSLPQKHMNCVVCGKGFNSVYDDELDIYPIYHPKKEIRRFEPASRFFSTNCF